MRAHNAELADCGIEWFVGRTNRVGSPAGYPGLFDNHSTLCKSTSLIRADIYEQVKRLTWPWGIETPTRNRAQSLETFQVADNDMTLNHALRSSCHGDGQHDDKGGWDHGETRGDGVDDDFLFGVKFVGAKDNDGADNCGA